MSTTFAISYMGLSVTARLDDALEVKMGLRTQRAPVEAIRFVYTMRTGDYVELLVAYDKPNGKRGILRVYGNQGDTQLTALAEALAALKPGGDLRGKPRREALKTMGATDTMLVVMVAVPVGLTALLFFALSPMIIPLFDHGSQSVNVAELGKVKLTTRHLVLHGELDTERYLEVTNTKNGTKTSATFQIPVFPLDAPADAFVPVVLKTRELRGRAMSDVAARSEWKCTLRDILWDGLAGDDRVFMHDELHLNITEDTLLCELETDDDPPAMVMIGGLLFGSLCVSGIIVLALWLQRRKNT